MTVIRYGEPEDNRIECPECKSLLAFANSDIVYDTIKYLEKCRTIDRLTCPVCHNKIFLGIDGKRDYKFVIQDGIIYWELKK